MSNVYYTPEDYGLTEVAEIEYSDGNYQFDTRVVWKDADGKMYTARDSGCSCPIPFEDYNSVDSLDNFDFETIRKEVTDELQSDYRNINPDMAQKFLEAIRN